MSVEQFVSPQATDDRFSKLMDAQEWHALPLAVQRRFSKALSAGQSVTYVGKITAFRRNWAGRVLAHVLRAVGGPLPLCPELGMATVVSVTEDAAGKGQNWTRLYANKHGFPQVIHSAKRFAGPSGLEEHIGAGLLMALAVRQDDGVLVFESRGFYLNLLGSRLRLPEWMMPGKVQVRHRDLGFGRFEFSLSVVHGLIGELIYQAAEYSEARL